MTIKTTRSDILDKAKECVCGQREQDYDSPENNFRIIANLWNSYLGDNYISEEDVAMMMALLKIARIRSGNYKADSFVDLAGYAACGGEIASIKNQKETFLEMPFNLKENDDVDTE